MPSPKPLCSADELLSGRWQRRSPPLRSIDQVVEAYNYRPYKALTTEDHGIVNTWETRQDGMYCSVEYVKNVTEDTLRKDEQRILNVASWQWQSDAHQRGECRIEQWDWNRVVKRLVMSPAGLVFIGDSITAQQYDSFALLLGNKPPIIERVISPHERRLNAGRALFLDPAHPLSIELLQELPFKVPLERIERPLVQSMRSNYMTTEADIKAANLTLSHGSHELRPTDFDDNLTRLVGDNGTVSNDVPWMSSIIVTSVGNWWERYIDASDSVSEALEQYKFAMQRAFARLDRLSRQQQYTVVYRSVNRGTLECERHSEPIEPTNKTSVDQIGAYAWYLKQPMSDMWRSMLSKVVEQGDDRVVLNGDLTTDEGAGSKRDLTRRARWISLDIEDMSYQRPEAHRYPGMDCLHWCLPSVLDDWNWAMWHLLQRNEPME
ncbi:hypothetical protein OIV83_004204 [Microbotryomycetes sp. JL201]|nr:hypothetical protein OIV83_004204 [Microbotryomycetes sp. JL201]